MPPSELCINLWFYVDIGTGLCYNWSGRVYSLFGDDEGKTKNLKLLAETDFITVPRESFPKEWMFVLGDQKLESQFPAGQINTILDNQFDYFSGILENHLPQLFSFDGSTASNGKAVSQTIPKEPLFVSTILMENERGEVRPNTHSLNKAWIEKERIRMNNLRPY
jgi:hypothetical protein